MHLGSVSFLALPLPWSLSESEGWETKPGASLRLQSEFPPLSEALFLSKVTVPGDRFLSRRQREFWLACPAGVLGMFEPQHLGQFLHIQLGIVTGVGKGQGVSQAKQKNGE